MLALLQSSRRWMALAAFLTCVGFVLANTEPSAPNFVGGKDAKTEKKDDKKPAPGYSDIDEVMRLVLEANRKRVMGIQQRELRLLEEAQQRAAELAQQPGGFKRPPGRFGGNAPTNRLGVRLQQPDDTLIAQLGLAEGTGVVLAEVPEGSVGARAGFMASDILLKLAGKDVSSTLIEFTSALDAIKADTPIDAVVLRKGKEETIKGIKLPEMQAEPRFNPFQRRFQINPLKQ